MPSVHSNISFLYSLKKNVNRNSIFANEVLVVRLYPEYCTDLRTGEACSTLLPADAGSAGLTAAAVGVRTAGLGTHSLTKNNIYFTSVYQMDHYS